MSPGNTSDRVRLVLAFFAIYVLWGSTYLAIRVVVETVPPLFAASVRFVIAGAILFLWGRMRGQDGPSRHEWRNVAILGALMFLLPYSVLFWAQQTIPSGVASVLVATIPLWTALLEMFVFGGEPRRLSTLGAIVLGLAGVAVLAFDPRGGGINLLACLVVTASQMSWSLGTALTTRMRLPKGHLVSAGGQMATGGAMILACSMALGEVPPLPDISWRAAAALAYLIVAGAIAFTAYGWLLGRASATKITSFAYVNPVVALALGHQLGGEIIGARTIVGVVLVLASTITLLRRRETAPG